MLSRLRLYAINTFIAVILAVMGMAALPHTPMGLQVLVRPILARVGIKQGPWTLFSPDADRVNLRLRAEITYRDGKKATWVMPDWRNLSAWEMFTMHRERAWWSHIVSEDGGPTWEPSCRYLAKQMRPDLADADRGAEVTLIYQEAPIPPAEYKPWPSVREALPFDNGWILTREQLE